MEQFGYRKSKLASWRLAGENPQDVVDLTEQCAVPPLSDMLANVLAGRGTGLVPTAYDEDDDFDISLTDKLDLEAQRQGLSERVRAERERKKTGQDAEKPQGEDQGAHGELSRENHAVTSEFSLDAPPAEHISSAE